MNGDDENGALPAGWSEAPLLALLTSLESGKRPRGGVGDIEEGVPSIGGEHLTSTGGFDFTKLKYVPREFATSMRRGHIRAGDVLVVKDGATTGKTVLVGEDFPFAEAVANEHLFVCRLAAGVAPDFVASFLRSPDGQRRVLAHFQGAAQGGINRSFASGTVLPVPPAAEQRRIAEHLERVERHRFSVGIHLRAGQLVLDRLQRAVLSAACSGRLTEDWRESHPGVTSDSLHAELIKARRSGRARLANKPTERGLASEAQLELLPSSWSLVRLGDVFDVGTGATPLRKNPAFYDGGTIPWVTSGAVNAGTITSPTELITPLALEETNVKLFPVGTLLVAMYGEGKTRGRVAELGIEAGSNQAVAAVLFTRTTARIRPFIRLFFEDSYLRMRALSAGGVQPNLNLGLIKDTLFPLPPYEEQVEIVRRATFALETADRLTGQIRKVESGVNRTLASVLAKAFRGDLVPTEAALASHAGRGFESGSELLARVSAAGPNDDEDALVSSSRS